MKIRLLHVVVFFLCLSLLITAFFYFSKETYNSNYSISRQIKYSFTLQNKTNRVLRNVVFKAYAPVKSTSFQLCQSVNASHPYTLQTDEAGNQILQFTFETFPPFSTSIVKIKADMLFTAIPVSVKAGTKLNTIPQPFIESDHPEIIAVSDSLKKKHVIDYCRSIHNWIAGHIEYAGYINQDRGALYALKNKKGDCTEFANLYVALCRAGNIPARSVGGYICPENQVLKPEDYHNWAEFYHDRCWLISDPQNKKFMTEQTYYVAMKILTPEVTTGTNAFSRYHTDTDGLNVKMN